MQKEQNLLDLIRNYETSSKKESIDIHYLRDVVIKYLLYLAEKKKKDASKCETVLFTVLNLSPEEIQKFD
jgi:hypothetical protein